MIRSKATVFDQIGWQRVFNVWNHCGYVSLRFSQHFAKFAPPPKNDCTYTLSTAQEARVAGLLVQAVTTEEARYAKLNRLADRGRLAVHIGSELVQRIDSLRFVVFLSEQKNGCARADSFVERSEN